MNVNLVRYKSPPSSGLIYCIFTALMAKYRKFIVMGKVFVNIANARGREKLQQQLQEIIDAGDDPFAPETLNKYHENPILKRWKYWYTTKSAYPYPGSNQHFLLIANEYAESVSDLSKEAFSELHDVINDLNKEYDISGGGFWMRYGDTNLTGATVKRLHAHLVSKDPDGNGVKIPLG